MQTQLFVAALLLATAAFAATATAPATAAPFSFSVADDKFQLDGQPFQLISGAIHYFRIHPSLFRDRLVRCKALGLNTVEIYIPWNLHEPYPGQYVWDGSANLEQFISIADDLGLFVILRPGPYICAEWDFGGFPWWLGSSIIDGGGTMNLRSSDPLYLAHVDRWWGHLLPRLRPFMRSRGGPVLMVQIENEYGFCGNTDLTYLRHLKQLALQHLGQDTLFFTTDPAHVAPTGTLPGDEILTTVDFGPQWFDPEQFYAVQKSLNAPGKSPPMCSEFYSGWLSHWGEVMANTSAVTLMQDTETLLMWANGTGNLNFYMVHGGTNFGFYAGANLEGTDHDGTYQPHITSYDYDAPISEAGDYWQPGIGGDGCKYDMIKQIIANVTGKKLSQLPPTPPRPSIQAYGSTTPMTPVASLIKDAEKLVGPPLRMKLPKTMEDMNQRWGLALYRTIIPKTNVVVTPLAHTGHDDDDKHELVLDLGAPVHDYATVFINGVVVGNLERNGDVAVNLTAKTAATATAAEDEDDDDEVVVLDILVEAMGRQNFGCNMYGAWDLKGLQSTNITLNGQPLLDWEVFNYQLDDLATLPTVATATGSAIETPQRQAPVARRLHMSTTQETSSLHSQSSKKSFSPATFYRGTLYIDDNNANKNLIITDAGGEQHLACTYLSTHGWGKGIAWVNGFNLGWYWPSKGPQMTLYVPGPVLKVGDNDVVFLEVESEMLMDSKEELVVRFVYDADFHGPKVDK